MKVQIFDGGSVSEVEIAQVATFGELKTALSTAGATIDYEAKSVVVKPGNTTLELNEAVIPTTDNLIVFLFPKRTKSGASDIECSIQNLIGDVVDAVLDYIDEHYTDVEDINGDAVLSAVLSKCTSIPVVTDPVISSLQVEYNKMREQL